MTGSEQHINSAFDQDLITLNEQVGELARLAGIQFENAIDALATQNEDQLNAVISGDKALDELEAQINEKALEVIAIRAPRAADLRHVLVALKVAAIL
ncbi:MAG: PhoU domain-containing protein, partial [Candidatus Puniceispirillum sp.]